MIAPIIRTIFIASAACGTGLGVGAYCGYNAIPAVKSTVSTVVGWVTPKKKRR